ncbi:MULTISPECIES: Fe-S cluster assembly protein SufD [Corynebacterium]|uniref:Fe-S cluster assembly protein SufD n=1 Tax=Corynebacterium TaxID=1716 RepID=UPI0008A6048A|nr:MULTISPECIES: Fe-S cluster assembly protein SufD [Corynebacterium]MBC6796832.1 Fe-S cluster assembly protein SufD [Corynebacterium sp. LK31]MCT1546729.1 Fe-S cluster assembly protein SufD [Corynebacterium amycolatum]MDK8726222.1 Fe-S cluster assembly protein SufD [Corynebacterium amycolatum]OFM17040.1 Fe-S cluster assembly protein SufD [Corynebacterium sp. HMSC077G01]OHR38191.1 Fe-S cluster assembly protein SufD [Corynebacterium sp. HMSC075F02]
MTTTINNENQAAHSRRVLANKGDVFTSFNVEDFAVPHGKDEEWKFTPLRKLRGLHNGTAAEPVAASISVETAGQDGVAVDVVKRDDERLGRAGAPTDRVAAQAYSNFDDAHIVTFAKNSVSKEPVVIDIDGPGEDKVSYGHIVIDVQSHAEAVCVINYRGSGTFADNIEFVIGDGAKLGVVTMVNWNEDAVHGSAHHVRVGRDATLRHTVATFGGEVVRIVPRVAFTAPGGDVDLLGVYFADAGQYFENRMLVDHAVPNCRSNVMYKGALQGEPNVAHREARTAWVGDVLIRAEATGTDTYELNRNLLLTEGARADAVPNLEIETGEIAGAGHAATVGRFDEEQLFYLLSRGIPELAARRLVVRGFFSEVINLIPVESVREKLEKLVDEELNTAGF